MCSKFFFLSHSQRQPSTYSTFCLAITTVRDAVKTNFGSATSGDILERSFLVCVKPDDELFCNFLASEFTAVTLIANAGITPILHTLGAKV